MASNNSNEWLDECRAPTFVDFRAIDDDNHSDTFFETDNDPSNVTTYFTPLKTPRGPGRNEETAAGGERKKLKARRSFSVQGNDEIANTSAALESMLSLKSPFKAHGMITRQDVEKETRTIDLRTRKVSVKPSLKRKHETTEIRAAKFPKNMTLAESVLRFQVATPPRFHTVSSLFKPAFKKEERRPVTIPNSPHLTTMEHSNTHSCSEDKEPVFSQIKPVPLNRKIFESPKLARPEPKPVTVLQPFNLTKLPDKPKLETVDEKHEFIAKPVPISCIEGDELGKKNRRKWGAPTPVEFTAKQASSTSIKPFSFEERERKRLLERDKKLKKMRELQCKIAPFRATPLPSFIQNSLETMSTDSTSSLHSHHSCAPSTPSKTFKARPASVLYQEPFVPQTVKIPPVKPLDITLSTEARAQKRLEFDQLRKLKEKERKEAQEENERFKEELERQEVRELRKNLIHKPVPIPKT